MFPRSKNLSKLLKWEWELWFAWVAAFAPVSAVNWLCFVGCEGMFGILQRWEGSPPGPGQPEGPLSKQMSSWHEA